MANSKWRMHMNKYIKDYVEQKEEREKRRLAKEVNKIIQSLEIGEKVYDEQYKPSSNEFPKYDEEKKLAYKYDIGDASLEEYKLFLQMFAPKKETVKPIVITKLSGWFKFATVMMVLSGIGLLSLIIVSYNENDFGYFLIGLGGFLTMSLFCGILQLLAEIKRGIDNLQNKEK